MGREREIRAYLAEQLPDKVGHEVAIIGRSNVGKSSLINALLKTNIAQVSKSPGSTLWVGIHKFEQVTLIDLPGYGYAKTSKSRKNIVNELVLDYFKLKRTDSLILLIDMRRGIQEMDEQVLDYILQLSSITRVVLVGTKSDKKATKETGLDLCCSSKDGSGLIQLKSMIQSFEPTHKDFP